MTAGNALLREDANAPWYAGVTPRHWRILWGSYLGWIFDGYEAVALVYALRPALNSILTPEQAQAPAYYVGLAIGITLLGWGFGGLLGGIAADYIGRRPVTYLNDLYVKSTFQLGLEASYRFDIEQAPWLKAPR